MIRGFCFATNGVGAEAWLVDDFRHLFAYSLPHGRRAGIDSKNETGREDLL
jgi:hypothetical protein